MNLVNSALRRQLIAGLEPGRDTDGVENSSRNIPGNANNYFRAVSLVDPAYEPAGSLPSVVGNLVQASATDIAPYLSDTMSLGEMWKAVAGIRYDRYNASLTNSINLPPSASQSIGYTSVRAGLIWQPGAVQSYYASYGTSFNPSLETLTLVNGQQSLDPESSRQYEVGAKWDLMDGDLSVTSALFEIDKYHTRTQISAGVYELPATFASADSGERRGPHRPRLAGLRRLHVSRRRDRRSVGARRHARQGTGQHTAQQRVAVDFVQSDARMADRHGPDVHVGSLHVEQQCGQGLPTTCAGTR